MAKKKSKEELNLDNLEKYQFLLGKSLFSTCNDLKLLNMYVRNSTSFLVDILR